MSAASSRDRLIDLLLLGKQPSLGVRLRIAVDVLGELGEARTVAPRSAAGPTLEEVVLDDDGRARLSATGDLTGGAALVWGSILAGVRAPQRPPQLRDVTNEVRPNVDDLVQRALSPATGPITAEELASQLMLLGESFIASRATVAAQLLSRQSDGPSSRAAAEANREALAAAATTARLLTGTLAGPDSGDVSPGTVLFIHSDESGAAARLGRAIEEAGFTLVVRKDAIAALDALAWVQPVCIVCDCDLRGAPGDSLAQRLRKKDSELALTPLLLLASPSETHIDVARLDAGADACMSKPYRPGEVVAQIRALAGMAKRFRGARSALPRLEANKHTGFAGDLVQMSITAVLTVLEIERCTGTFEVTSQAGTVSLDLVSGMLMGGTANGKPLAPVGALRIMISRKTGKFSFEPGGAGSPTAKGVAIAGALDAALRLERATPVRSHSPVSLMPASPPAGSSRREDPDKKG